MVGTAGNLSTRLDDESFWITVSGKDKGELQTEDFIRVQPDGSVVERSHPGDKPSAETSIHETIYRMFPDARACFHVHSVPANIISSFAELGLLTLPPLEMIKGLGIWEENPQVSLDVFENHLNVPSVAKEIEKRFSKSRPQVPALLIRFHGITVWAPSIREARNRLEVLEFVFSYMVEMKKLER